MYLLDVRGQSNYIFVVYGHFSGQEMLVAMNSDGTEVKIEVRENVFCVS